MSFNKEKLYELLPAHHRVRDQEVKIQLGTKEGPLEELLGVLAEQISVLEENLNQLYDDQFIETAADWVVPYIGDLIGTRLVQDINDGLFSQRAEVANTIAYRRRKGTAVVIEQLARDITGWSANVVEYFLLLACTQYLNHIRPNNKFTLDLRDHSLLQNINKPFDKSSRSLDVRKIDVKRGKYNIPNIGIHLWRINCYSVSKMNAYKVDDRRYIFDALGNDTALFNLPKTEKNISELAKLSNVPRMIARKEFSDNPDQFYGPDSSVLIYVNDIPVIPEEINPTLQIDDLISICNLKDTDDLSSWNNLPVDKIAIDPELGRIAFPSSQPPPENVQVSYYHGFPASLGGGEYVRGHSMDESIQPVFTVPGDFNTIQEALNAITGSGVVEITENRVFAEDLNINLAENAKVEIRSANRIRPVLAVENEITIVGGSSSDLIFNGIVIHGGRLFVPDNSANEIATVSIRHCTLVPGALNSIGTILAQPNQPRIENELPNLKLTIERTVTGSIRAVDGSIVHIFDSIVDASDQTEVAFSAPDGLSAGAELSVENATIIGKLHTIAMTLVSNTILDAQLAVGDIWTSPVKAKRLQKGCIRYSYYPKGSSVPKAFNCLSKAGLVPVFTSIIYGNPGYCQLSSRCSSEIRNGADNGSEMGVYNHLLQPLREKNLKTRLKEYLRFGMDAGIFYAS